METMTTMGQEQAIASVTQPLSPFLSPSLSLSSTFFSLLLLLFLLILLLFLLLPSPSPFSFSLLLLSPSEPIIVPARKEGNKVWVALVYCLCWLSLHSPLQRQPSPHLHLRSPFFPFLLLSPVVTRPQQLQRPPMPLTFLMSVLGKERSKKKQSSHVNERRNRSLPYLPLSLTHLSLSLSHPKGSDL